MEVNARLFAAVKRNDTSEIVLLANASADLQDEVLRLRELEMDYEASQAGLSQAEADLAQGASEARRHVRSMESVASALQAVADVSGTITRLLGLFA